MSIPYVVPSKAPFAVQVLTQGQLEMCLRRASNARERGFWDLARFWQDCANYLTAPWWVSWDVD